MAKKTRLTPKSRLASKKLTTTKTNGIFGNGNIQNSIVSLLAQTSKTENISIIENLVSMLSKEMDNVERMTEDISILIQENENLKHELKRAKQKKKRELSKGA